MSDSTQYPPLAPTSQSTRWRLPKSATWQRPSRLELLLLLGIVLLAGGLRAYQLGYKSLWLEEIVAMRSAQPGGLFSLAGITHPPLYLFIMRLLGELSHAEWLLRLPAMLAGVAGVVALWALGRSLLGPLPGLLAAFMLALSALHLETSQEVQSYAFFGLLSTLLLWSLLRAANREMQATQGNPGEPVGTAQKPVVTWLAVWWPFVLVAVLALYTHPYALAPVGLSLLVFPCLLLGVVPGSLALLWREPARRRALRNLLAALAVVALLTLPLVISGLASSAQVASAVEANALQAQSTLAPIPVFDTLVAFISNRSPWSLDPLFVPTMLLLALVGLVGLFWRRRAVAVALTLWIALPLLASLAYKTSPSAAPAQLSFILPILLLVVASGVAAVGQLAAHVVQRLAPDSPEYVAGANAAVLALFLLAFVKGSTDPLRATYAQPKQDWKRLATILASAPGPNDAIVILANAANPLEWYYQGRGQVVENNLVSELEGLCQSSPAVYVATATTGAPISPAEASFLQQNYIEVPLKDLNLYYRNCQGDAWYGAGAETLFPLSRRAGLAFPQSRRAQEQFDILAAQSGYVPAAAQASSSPRNTPSTAVKTVPVEDTALAVQVTPAADAATAVPPSAPPLAQDDQALDVGALLAAQAEAAPTDALAQVRLGALALQQGASPRQAGEYFQRAVDLDPAAWLAYGLWANSLGNTGQITQAVQIVNQGLATTPDSLALQTMQARWQGAPAAAASNEALLAALETARAAMRDRNWDDAIAAAQQAIALAPARYEPQLVLGDAYRGLSELSQALQAYQRATELAPYLSILHGRQAEMLARLERTDEAIAAGLTALSIDQSRWENWYALGRAYLVGALAKDTGAASLAPAEAARLAEASLLRAQELAPAENQAPARSLAELRAALPQPATSSTTVEPTPEPVVDFAKMTGQQKNAARARADQTLRDGLAAEALPIFQQLVAVDGQDRASRMGLANALAALGRTDEALVEFEAISVDWPDFPFARIRQGALLEEQDDLAGALVAYREAVRVAPDNADTHFTLAYALRRAGQRDEAIAEFEAGLTVDPAREAARAALEALKSEQ